MSKKPAPPEPRKQKPTAAHVTHVTGLMLKAQSDLSRAKERVRIRAGSPWKLQFRDKEGQYWALLRKSSGLTLPHTTLTVS